MEDLDSVMNEVKLLTNDLGALLQKEKGHMELVEEHGKGSYHRDGPILKEKYMIDQPEIPDLGKRTSASMELRLIFETSNWYSARYAAGFALMVYDSADEDSFDTVNDFVPVWINELIPRLESTTSTAITVKGNNLPRMFYGLVDQQARLDTVKDAGGLYRQSFSPVAKSFLTSVYNGEYDYLLEKGIEHVDSNGDPLKLGLASEVRKEAGRQLGYSGFRIMAHEEPVKAAVTGLLAAVGVACTAYFLYSLYQSPKEVMDSIGESLSHLNNS